MYDLTNWLASYEQVSQDEYLPTCVYNPAKQDFEGLEALSRHVPSIQIRGKPGKTRYTQRRKRHRNERKKQNIQLLPLEESPNYTRARIASVGLVQAGLNLFFMGKRHLLSM